MYNFPSDAPRAPQNQQTRAIVNTTPALNLFLCSHLPGEPAREPVRKPVIALLLLLLLQLPPSTYSTADTCLILPPKCQSILEMALKPATGHSHLPTELLMLSQLGSLFYLAPFNPPQGSELGTRLLRPLQ